MRKINKGKLGQIVMKEIDTTETLEEKKEHTAYIVDFMAFICTITKLPDTFKTCVENGILYSKGLWS